MNNATIAESVVPDPCGPHMLIWGDTLRIQPGFLRARSINIHVLRITLSSLSCSSFPWMIRLVLRFDSSLKIPVKCRTRVINGNHLLDYVFNIQKQQLNNCGTLNDADISLNSRTVTELPTQ